MGDQLPMVDIRQIAGQQIEPDGDGIARLPVKSWVTALKYNVPTPKAKSDFAQFIALFDGIVLWSISLTAPAVISISETGTGGNAQKTTSPALQGQKVPANQWWTIPFQISDGNTYALQVSQMQADGVAVKAIASPNG